MSHLKQLFYISRMTDGVDERAIRNILAISRRNNRMLDVTGCLCFTGQHFAQVLEGREDAVAQLRDRIYADPRHAGFRVMLERSTTLRDYPLWSMAYLLDVERAGEITALYGAPEASTRKSLQMMSRLKPDTVMGAL